MNSDDFYMKWNGCLTRTSYVPKLDVNLIRRIRLDNGDLIYANMSEMVQIGSTENGKPVERTFIKFKLNVCDDVYDVAMVDVKHISDVY
ncbi:DUF1659 domain-containing protein [Thermoplasma acidophilum]|nr:DUF1659 domain-containing protein [Thermoplasma acidophilum]